MTKFWLNTVFIPGKRSRRAGPRVGGALEKGGLGERGALSLFHNIAKAVYHLHENEIVHRNLTVIIINPYPPSAPLP